MNLSIGADRIVGATQEAVAIMATVFSSISNQVERRMDHAEAAPANELSVRQQGCVRQRRGTVKGGDIGLAVDMNDELGGGP